MIWVFSQKDFGRKRSLAKQIEDIEQTNCPIHFIDQGKRIRSSE